MPSVYQTTQYRQRRRQAAERSPLGRLGLGCAGLLSLLIALALVAAAWEWSQVTQNLPSIEGLPALLDPPDGALLQPTRIYDRSGQHLLLELSNPAAPERKFLYLPDSTAEGEKFSEPLVQATLAAVDPNFWRHGGYSLAGIFTDGHPTIAQRLVSALLLPDEPPSLRRTLRERLLAAQITSRFGRERILEWYLNSADYGRMVYGAAAASRLYFMKEASDLDLAEAAVLAGILLEPQQNPIDTPAVALEHQKQLLLKMMAGGLIRPDEATQAAQESIRLQPGPHPGQPLQIDDLGRPGVDLAFIKIALRQVETQIPQALIERGGLKILTTLDHNLNGEVVCATGRQLSALAQPLSQGGSSAADGCEAARLLPEIQTGYSSAALGAQVVVLEPQTGQILALSAFPMEPIQTEALLAPRPIGTLGTPFIYLTAFTRGFSPASLVWDIPSETDLSSGGNLLDTQKYHGPVRMRIALANDYLPPTDKLIGQIGIENIWRTLQQLGITAPMDAAGGSDSPQPPSAVSLFRPMDPLEIAQAYGVLANNGLLAGHSSQTSEEASPYTPAPIQPYAVLRVEAANPQAQSSLPALDWSAWQSRPIITPQLAYLMTNVLSDETARWASLSHPNPLEIGRPAAAKIGRDPSGAGAWVAGYTPDRVAVVWLGRREDQTADAAPDDAGLFANAAAGLYHAILMTAGAGQPAAGWNPPNGITTVQVCDPSGMLPTAYCPNVVDEVFLDGNQPLQADRLYSSVPVDRDTGQLATIFTPPDVIENRPYMQVPPEAQAWAQQSGLQTPPQTYDSIASDIPQLKDTQITSPQMIAVVHGQVTVVGTAAGEGFSFYRLQVGQGLNPQDWFQIGEDVSRPVNAGLLGAWDTQGKSGLYVIELQVVHQDQSVETADTLVTVDNEPPQVEIVSPVDQEEIDLSGRQQMVFLAKVEDDLGEAKVEMYLDGRLLAAFSRSPYAFLWKCTVGAHNLRVVAIDQAGNRAETSTPFIVANK